MRAHRYEPFAPGLAATCEISAIRTRRKLDAANNPTLTGVWI